jgi:hypothetical protein
MYMMLRQLCFLMLAGRVHNFELTQNGEKMALPIKHRDQISIFLYTVEILLKICPCLPSVTHCVHTCRSLNTIEGWL